MTQFDMKELQLITFLCMQRKQIVGLHEAEKEGTADIYRKACAMLREDDDE